MFELLTPEVSGLFLGQFGGLLAFWSKAWPYLAMVLGFSVIVFVHELGHFAVAKWAGVRVERFAVGFGREVLGFTWGETRYSFNILPLGGYVKMLGQEDFDDKSNELQFSSDPRSFINKPVGHRMAIVSAGVIMNVIFACLLFMVVFLIGMKAPGTHIGYVEPDSPADKAGLLPGDNIKRVNGEKILEFRDVSMAIQLASPHAPIEFVVEREGKRIDPIFVKADFRRPENTRDARRQIIGIASGVTREILWVGPGFDSSRTDQPHVGDMIVELDGVPVTDANANAMKEMLVYAQEVYVERKDPKNPNAPPQRVRVDIQPQLAIFPSDARDPDSVSVLGLTPLVRFDFVDLQGRAYLAGIEPGDTVVSWNDEKYPSRADVARAIADNAERDVPFRVQRADGTIRAGFVRPKPIRAGAGTIQAMVQAIPEEERSGDAAQARFMEVRRFGAAARAGIAVGDRIRRIADSNNPTAVEVTRVIRGSAGSSLPMLVEKADGRISSVVVRPELPGAIDASFRLVADDVLRTGEVVAEINDRPSPAAEAGIPRGALIQSVNGTVVTRWRELIDAFRANAGKTVEVAYVTDGESSQTAALRVPHCLRTLLGAGPEARIVSIDGRRTVMIRSTRGDEEVFIGYHEGMRTLLESLVGQKNVPVVYRPTPLSEPVTAHVDITGDMVDPWVARIAYAPNVMVGDEIQLLKGETAWEAVEIGIHKTYYFILQVYETMNRMIFSQSVGVENLSGPLGIVSIGGQIARAGFVEFLFFMAIISANLAVINFLPLPIVDGGLMVFLIIEKIKGSPVSLRVQVATQVIGLFLIVGAFLFVTYNDVLRIWG